MNGLASGTSATRGLKCYYVSLLLVLWSPLAWALFTLWQGSGPSNLLLEWKKLNSDWFSWGHMPIVESITVTRRNWPSYWSILCDSGSKEIRVRSVTDGLHRGEDPKRQEEQLSVDNANYRSQPPLSNCLRHPFEFWELLPVTKTLVQKRKSWWVANSL